MKKRAFTTILFTVSIVTAFVLAGCSNNTDNGTSTEIGYGSVIKMTLTTTIEASGSIEPRQVASVAWSTSGAIGDILVNIGQQVQSNDILMALDEDSISESISNSQMKLAEMTSPSAVAEAEQAVLDAQSDFDDAIYTRTWLDYVDEGILNNAYAEYIIAKDKYEAALDDYETLIEENPELTEDDLELAQAYTVLYQAEEDMEDAEYIYEMYNSVSSEQTYAEYDNAVILAENNLADAKNYLSAIKGEDIPEDATSSDLLNFYEILEEIDEVNLRAPIKGTVGVIYDDPGILVSEKHVSIELVDRSKLYLTIQLDESEIIQVSDGMSGVVSIDVIPDMEYSAQITNINPIGEISSGVVYYDVTLILDQADETIPLNASASVSIPIGEPQVTLLVPATAIQSDTEGEFVQVIIGETTQRVDVVSGTIMSDDTVVVTGDLSVGDEVVLVIETTTSENNAAGGLFGGMMSGDGSRGKQAPPSP